MTQCKVLADRYASGSNPFGVFLTLYLNLSLGKILKFNESVVEMSLPNNQLMGARDCHRIIN